MATPSNGKDASPSLGWIKPLIPIILLLIGGGGAFAQVQSQNSGISERMIEVLTTLERLEGQTADAIRRIEVVEAETAISQQISNEQLLDIAKTLERVVIQFDEGMRRLEAVESDFSNTQQSTSHRLSALETGGVVMHRSQMDIVKILDDIHDTQESLVAAIRSTENRLFKLEHSLSSSSLPPGDTSSLPPGHPSRHSIPPGVSRRGA